MTTYLPTIPELTLLGAFDRMVPRLERVVMKAEFAIDLGLYVIALGVRNPGVEPLTTPLVDSTLWLGSKSIPANDWVFLYTGEGTPMVMPSHDKTCNLHILFWNRKHTVFNDERVIPLLWRLNAITIEKSVVPAPTIGSLFGPLLADTKAP